MFNQSLFHNLSRLALSLRQDCSSPICKSGKMEIYSFRCSLRRDSLVEFSDRTEQDFEWVAGVKCLDCGYETELGSVVKMSVRSLD